MLMVNMHSMILDVSSIASFLSVARLVYVRFGFDFLAALLLESMELDGESVDESIEERDNGLSLSKFEDNESLSHDNDEVGGVFGLVSCSI